MTLAIGARNRAHARPAGAGTTLSVIVPAFNAGPFLPLVLPPLIAMRERGEVAEVILVDDGSTDGTAAQAAALGARVLATPERGGPGAARNLAAREAAGEVLWFVDSDVIAWADGAARIAGAFADASVHAVFGSYDAAPPGRGWMSKYKNLVHRFYHQGGRREASTFWAGCGAVRREAFLAVGGFDAETYARPSIEDIELGYRLRAAGGRILLLPDLLGTHLKVWTMQGVIETDIFRRALPWARLMVGREGVTDDLNTSWPERLRAGLAWLLVLALLALPLAPRLWEPSLLLAAASLAANGLLLGFLWRNGGPLLALRGFLWHQLYYLYSSAVFAWCWLEARRGGRAASRRRL
jgi:cellulose synthase/poly-beta-1,6-N-acetylglucosamine synthase-like glycosyltransferase